METPLYVLAEEGASLHMSKGNSKIGKGIWSFSTLPGNSEHMLRLKDGTLLTDVPGTCSRFCSECAKDGACYAWRDAKLHRNVTIQAWGENTLLLRSGRIWDDLETFLTLKNAKAIKKAKEGGSAAEAKALATVKTFRIHVSGELEDADQLRRWNDLAAKHPETVFGIYTKNFDALGEYLDAGSDFADNLVVNVSGWHGIENPFLEKYSWAKLNVFIYDDGADPGLKTVTHCPAVTAEGKHAKRPDGSPITCDMCRRCYTKTGRKTAVYAH